MSRSNRTSSHVDRRAATIYLDPILLRLFRLGHTVLRDLRILVPATTLGVVWELGRHDAVIPGYLWAAPSTVVRWLIRVHVAQWFPVAVAALALLVVLHVGTRMLARTLADDKVNQIDKADVPLAQKERVANKAMRRALVMSVWTAVGALAAALVALSDSPGDFWTRYLPLVVGVVLGYLVRRRRRTSRLARLWQPTRCGFRPSLRPLTNVFMYQALRDCDLADFAAPTLITERAVAAFTNSRDLLIGRRDFTSAAWCVARAVEYALQFGDIATAERLLDEAAKVASLAGHRTVASARALFLLAIGQPAEASDTLNAVRERTGWRTPRRLRDQLALIEASRRDGPGDSRSRARPPYRRMAWRRQYDEIARWVLLDAITHRQADESAAMATAFTVRAKCDAVLNEFADEIDAICMAGLFRAEADAWRIQGDCAAALNLHQMAFIAYWQAYESYIGVKDQAAVSECLLLSSIEATNAGYADFSHQLDIIRFGLQLLEQGRTGLRHAAHRVTALTQRHELYARVFETVTRHMYLAEPEKAGEVCLWLIESQQRNALGDVLRNGGLTLDEQLREQLDTLEAHIRVLPEQDFTQLAHDLLNTRTPFGGIADAVAREYTEAYAAEPIDLEAVLARLGGNCALLYDATRESDGWSFRTVVVSAVAGITVHTSRLRGRPKDAGRSWFMTPLGVLDALNAGASAKVAAAHRVPLDDLVWREIADAVLPPTLIEVLRRHSARQLNPVLLVVPDGPIAALPLPGMRFRDGSMLMDHAGVAFTPSLTLLSPADGGRRTRPTVVAVHINTKSLKETEAETRVWYDAPKTVELRASDNRAGLRESLIAEPPPDIAVIATHGYRAPDALADSILLGDDSILSASSALFWRWPEIVLLGSCWTGSVKARRGQEPIGFPVACLLGGAKTVVSALSAVDDRTAGRLLARVGADLIAGRELVPSLRFHTSDLVNSAPDMREVPASWWAALVTWTIQPPNAADLSDWSPVLSYDAEGISSDDARDDPTASASSATPKFLPLSGRLPIGERVQETLRYAAANGHRSCVTTLDFFGAACVVDYGQSANWTAFTVLCGVGRPAPDWPTGEPTEPLTELLLDGDHRILVSTRLARAVELGGRLASHQSDRVIAPRHVVYGVVADGSSDAARWLGSGMDRLPTAALLAGLGDRLFFADLPDPATVGLRESGGEVAVPEILAPQKTSLDWLLAYAGATDLRKRIRRWTAAVVVILVLSTGGFLKTMSAVRDNARSEGFLGISATSSTDASGSAVTSIVGVVEHGPGALAGLRDGDIVLDIDGLSGPNPSDITAMVRRHHPGEVIAINVRHDGVVKNFSVRLTDAVTGLGLIRQP